MDGIIAMAKGTEYFCNDCGQIRLSLIVDKSKCDNCGSKNIIVGKINELDVEALKNNYLKEKTNGLDNTRTSRRSGGTRRT